MNLKELSEQDIRTKIITPAIVDAGWDIKTQLREEVYLTDGRITVRGNLTSRGKRKFADYVLYYKPGIPLAVVEAKDNNHTVGDGMQQALHYAEMLGVPFAFSSNGDAFRMHDDTATATLEDNIKLHEFPSPEELWKRYKAWKEIPEETADVVVQDYYSDATGMTPRYYQLNAINKTIEAIAKGQNRILLVMATGTGKTYTAFQIIWRLWKSGAKKRILFLADRNILVDQTRNDDFSPFGPAMYKVKNRQAPKQYEIYLSLYQAVTGTAEDQNIYKQFSQDFFDLIIVDECHRGSAAETSAWREILEYFSSATQIGMTATPKETKSVSNISYFGEPVYTYSLKQGIEDGYLAPYKVVRFDLDKDLLGWRPHQGMLDDNGLLIEDRVYNVSDMDRQLVLTRRTELVAKKVTEFLKGTDRYAKTIVFCEDTEHADRMRQALVNENADLAASNRKYVMRITGNDPDGQDELDNFISPEEPYPVIATTSKLLSTGVNTKTVKLIVLDSNIKSMTEFKQIIGRGTRIVEEFDKRYFTIMDFKKVTELFADPDFDGEPDVVYVPEPDGSPIPPDDPQPDDGPPSPGTPDFPEPDPEPAGQRRVKYIVQGVNVTVLAERIQYLGPDGKLITESLKDYTRKTVMDEFETLSDFLKGWNSSQKKKVIIETLSNQGVIFEELHKLVGEKGKEYGPFDLICHIVYDQPPLTRRERAENVRKRNYFTKYGEKARKVLDGLLDHYADTGITEIEDRKVLKLPQFEEVGTITEILQDFGGPKGYEEAQQELEELLYGA